MISGIYLFFSTLMNKGIHDPAQAKGNITKAISYSFSGAMSPLKKESAYMHFPTYTAGMIYHIGTFLSFLCIFVLFFNFESMQWMRYAAASIIAIAAICGLAILIKRIQSKELRSFSNADDYFSNAFVTIFQALMAASLILPELLPVLFIYAAVLFIYIPIGKLKHTIFFFTSRIELGKYYGKRGVWPLKK